jgi:two-component system response regulator DesR
MTVHILVGNDHSLLLEALAGTLHAVEDFDVVGVARESDAVVPVLLRTNAQVAVLGAAGHGDAGLSLARQVMEVRPRCGVVIVAPNPTRTLVNQALRAGVLSVVPLDASLSHLIRTIRGVAVGCLSIHARTCVDSGLVAERRSCPLTDRERDVLRLSWAGASVKEIALDLYLASGTVRNIASGSLHKLKGRNRFDAARIAQENGWL